MEEKTIKTNLARSALGDVSIRQVDNGGFLVTWGRVLMSFGACSELVDMIEDLYRYPMAYEKAYNKFVGVSPRVEPLKYRSNARDCGEKEETGMEANQDSKPKHGVVYPKSLVYTRLSQDLIEELDSHIGEPGMESRGDVVRALLVNGLSRMREPSTR